MGHSGTDLKYSVTIYLYIFKTFFVQSFKKSVKIPILGLKKKDLFFKFHLIFKGPPLFYHKVDILTFWIMLHLETNFENLH